jgi:hypothetical protein
MFLFASAGVGKVSAFDARRVPGFELHARRRAAHLARPRIACVIPA